MSTWLTFFQSYLNPGKLAAVTVPGMVIAFALVLALGPVPCQKQADCPYFSANLKPVKDSADKAKTSTPVDVQLLIQGAAGKLQDELGPASSLDLTRQIEIFNGNRVPPKATAKENSPLSEILGAPSQEAESAKSKGATKPAAPAKTVDPAAIGVIDSSCLSLPRYIVQTSTSAIDVNDDKALKKAEQAAQKAALTLYAIAPTKDWKAPKPISTYPAIKSSDVADCSTVLSQIKEGAALDSKALTQFLTQAGADLTGLSSNLVTAQNLGQSLVAGSLQEQIRNKRDYIAWAQQEQAQVSNVQSAETTLEGRITPLVGVTTTAPAPVTPPSPSTVQDVMQTIQDNLIKFLILSLIIGQILDPLQRGAVSFFGPRRDFFIAFNEVYGRQGDGEIRYGDRRLWPWALKNGVPNEDEHEDGLIPAGRAYAKDQNIYDKNYAIGAGYITQSDASQIENDWFTQSQLTSGLVIPMVILSLSLGARAVCCSTTASGNWVWPTVIILCAMPLGIIIGGYLTSIVLHLSSKRYALVAGGLRSMFSTPNADAYVDAKEKLLRALHEREPKVKAELEVEGKVEASAEEKAPDTRAKKITFFLGFLTVVGLLAVLVTILPSDWKWLGWAANGPTTASLGFILIPLLTVIPLWVAGLDRLHKYYSELQARIGGNFVRLHDTTEQKFFDLLSDPKASCALKEKFDKTIEAREALEAYFKSLKRDCSKIKAESLAPAGDDPVAPPNVPPSGGDPGTGT